MNRVIIINLNGNAYQLEESGYEALRTYLDTAGRRLEGNPDKDEIIADIEQAIAEKFRTVLGANKTVVVTHEVTSVIAEMGPVQDAANSANADLGEATGSRNSDTPSASPDKQSADSGPRHADSAKRLYTIREGSMLFGVCNGLAAYFNIDATLVRLLFVVLTFFWGIGIPLYLLLALIVPTANTPAERAAAHGAAATAQEFIRRAKAGYYEGMKTFHDKQAHREWKRKFKREMKGWKQGFQYEMHRNANQWQQHWAQPPPTYRGPHFGSPFFWLIRGVLAVVALFAVFSLLHTGRLFGWSLPYGVPSWVGIIAVTRQPKHESGTVYRKRTCENEVCARFRPR
jgi:phage shock protein PspC (stress-responsive transcriptional regulator)